MKSIFVIYYLKVNSDCVNVIIISEENIYYLGYLCNNHITYIGKFLLYNHFVFLLQVITGKLISKAFSLPYIK